MSAKGEAMSEVLAEIIGNVVQLQPCKSDGLEVSFDRDPPRVCACSPQAI